MAEKRMFSKSVISSDSFLEMPSSTQCLYFHLSMNADDDGFVDKPKSIMRMIGAKEDDLKILIAKSFIIPFENGLIVIKHWKLNNYLRNDRYRETQYVNEKSHLAVAENGEYFLENDIVGIPMVSIDKNSIEKNSIEKNNTLSQKKSQNDTPNDVFLTDCVQNEMQKEAQNDIATAKKTKNEENDTLFSLTFEENEVVPLEEIDPKEEMFNEFWQEYPRKVNKKGAKTSFMRIKNLKKEFEKIMSALRESKRSKQWVKNSGQFVPHPQTWINQERWKDERQDIEGETMEKWLTK